MSERGPAATPAGMVVTEQQLAEALESLLGETNAFASLNGVVQQLESNFGVNLSHKIDFIRSHIHHFLLRQSQSQNFMLQQKDHFTLPQAPISTPLLPRICLRIWPDIIPRKCSNGEKKRGGPGGLNKLCGVSPVLQTIVGQPTLPRTEIYDVNANLVRSNIIPNASRGEGSIDFFQLFRVMIVVVERYENGDPPSANRRIATG
ncbi:UNVERIFIED_CONTAM: hypothetical protein Sradi_6386300 [Sesamum radiatum]|uniref:DEK-C domain-containing protein n=1 Tax=Sesamum radiatum TaxID=300843 RepID=A0AAW2K399_SESRA